MSVKDTYINTMFNMKKTPFTFGNRMAKFEKVSFEQFKKDWLDTFDEFSEDTDNELIKDIYDDIQLPKRSTAGSAGYDFRCPCDMTIPVNGVVKIPTGIRCHMDDGWVLKEYPRSSYGFKYGVHMANTVGIIDADYYNAANEGHIFIKLVNDSTMAKPIELKTGDAFCQGIFIPFGITVDDDTDMIRTGGIGSTGR